MRDNENKTCEDCKECPRNWHFDSWEGHQGYCDLTGKKVMLDDKACKAFKTSN